MPAEKISLNNAKEDKLFYFVANAVVYRESDGRCLILKRSEREKVHPGKWAVPGGKLEWEQFDLRKPTRVNGDVLDFESAVERDDVFKTAVQKRLICNKTRDRSIRLRPNLNLNAKEAQEAVSIFQDIYAHRGVR